jgi:hypothetical protein
MSFSGEKSATAVYDAYMEPLYRQAIKRSIVGSIVFLILIFLPAGTLAYWQGWVFFAVFASSTTAFTIYLALYDKPRQAS